MEKKIKDFINYLSRNRILGDCKYKIVEEFPKCKERTFFLSNLKASIEDGILLVYDKKEEIYGINCELRNMILSNIFNIEYIENGVVLHLKNGKITIDVL